MLDLEIRNWLKGARDFSEGLILLEKIEPRSLQLKIMSRTGSTRYNQDKLEEILSKHLAPVANDVKKSEASLGFPSYDFFSLPDDLQRDHIRKAELYRTAGKLHSKLADAETDQGRAEIAEIIMQCMEENKRCWERIDYFLQTGSTKKETHFVLPDLAGMEPLQLAKFKANNASNLSKWRKKVQLISDPKKKAELLERITHHEKLQEEVARML